MELYLAGSFGGAGQRKMLYASGAAHVLLSAGHKNAREAAEFISGEEGRDALRIYAAGLGNGDDNWTSSRAGGVQDILCSFGHGTSRLTADHFAPRNREEDMKSFLAGIPGDSVRNRELLDKSENKNILASFAAKETQATADHVSKKEPMKLFVAGNWGPQLQDTVCEETEEKNLLCTNAHKGAQQCAEHFAHNKFGNYHLLIDSGAFTAFKQGTPIVLTDYIEYAKKLRENAMCELEFIGLDMIPGHFDEIEVNGKKKKVFVPPTAAESEQACQIGYDNWKAMEAAGIPCIPTFHRGDDFKWLEKLASELPFGGRLCIAPKVDGTRVDVKLRWLNEVFRRLTLLNERFNFCRPADFRDKPAQLWERWKIHGLGISSQPLMEAFPWYSVDSTGWLWAAQNCAYRYFDRGQIQCLQRANGYLECGRDTERTRLANEHYLAPKTHKFQPHINGDECFECGQPEEGHREAQDDASLEIGAYWFGQEAIRADVQLARHVTAVWQRRGVFFEGEEILAEFDPAADQTWRQYNSHMDHADVDEAMGAAGLLEV